ncbi:MAG: pseudopilin PulG [Verrucomicrobia bacterium]|nr:MAG: pseudopilin PulG [Verrucomicrobiota bacterium]
MKCNTLRCLPRFLQTTKHGNQGYTLLELTVVVALLGLLYTLAAPSVLSSFEKARGRRCAANLLLLESAKDAFSLDHPGQTLTSAGQLLPYLKHGMPSCPSGGVYMNLTEAFAGCACSLNAQGSGVEKDGVHDSGL